MPLQRLKAIATDVGGHRSSVRYPLGLGPAATTIRKPTEPRGMPITVATRGKSLDQYEDWLVDVLLRSGEAKARNN